MASVGRIALLIGLAAEIGLLAFATPRQALSFAVGAVLSYLNFRLLEQGVSKAVEDPAKGNTKAVVWRFALRFVLYGGCLYAMISARSLHALTATLGLSLPVLAIIVKGFHDAALDLLTPGRP